ASVGPRPEVRCMTQRRIGRNHINTVDAGSQQSVKRRLRREVKCELQSDSFGLCNYKGTVKDNYTATCITTLRSSGRGKSSRGSKTLT
ncbi:hypothetical protein SK128_007571, partial [Halocaridina rubra]